MTSAALAAAEVIHDAEQAAADALAVDDYVRFGAAWNARSEIVEAEHGELAVWVRRSWTERRTRWNDQPHVPAWRPRPGVWGPLDASRGDGFLGIDRSVDTRRLSGLRVDDMAAHEIVAGDLVAIDPFGRVVLATRSLQHATHRVVSGGAGGVLEMQRLEDFTSLDLRVGQWVGGDVMRAARAAILKARGLARVVSVQPQLLVLDDPDVASRRRHRLSPADKERGRAFLESLQRKAKSKAPHR